MRSATEQSYQERVLEVLVYIEQHLDESLALEDLARIACFSPFHFHRIFRGIVGEPVREYVRRLRLERAAHRLLKPAPIREVADEAGYESHEAFTRAFEAQFGVSPSTYRNKRRTAHSPEPVSGVTRLPGSLASMDVVGVLEVRVVQTPPVRVCFSRHIGPFEEVGHSWMKLLFWAGPRGLLGPGTRFLTVWHDDPEVTAPERLRGDVCFTVNAEVSPEGPFGLQEIAGGEFAVAIHQGPYHLLGDTYAQICGPWAAEARREFRDLPAYEEYLNDPRQTAPEELLTAVYVALAGNRGPRVVEAI